jgi:hypothetical protein
LIQAEILALPPFADMTPEALSNAVVAIQIPSWLIGTQEACEVFSAAEDIFRRVVSLESTPSSAYTTAGYELCRKAYDAFECTGSGRLMALEYDGDLATASIIRTPLMWWARNPIIFSVRRGLSPDEMAV